MAQVTLPASNAPIEVVAAGGKGVVQCLAGAVLIENAADPSQGLALTQGEALAVDGWTSAWFAQSGIPGVESVLKIATE